MKLTRILGITCATILVTTASARAAVLANYPFTGQSFASIDTNVNSTASTIAFGSGLDATTHFTAAGNPGAALQINTGETDGTSFPTAITNNDFFGFTLDPISGRALELTTLTFDLAVSTTTVATNIRAQVSLNGTAYVTLDSVATFSSTAYTAQSFAFTTAQNTALASGSTLFVRFLVYDGSNNADLYTALDNIVVNGALVAAVPEPGTNALLTLGAIAAVGAFAWQRRRSAAL